MADKKISQLPAATVPLAGTEVLPIVQSGVTDQVSVANLTERRDVGAQNLTLSRYATYSVLSQTRAQGTFASPTPVANGQTLGSWNILGYTSANDYRVGAEITARVSAGVSGDELPTTLDFGTTADGASSPTTNLSISHTGNITVSTGNLVIGTSGKGIDFSANGGDVLTQYDEGTWTPTVTSQSGTITTYTATGIYTRVGREVFVQCKITLTNVGTATGIMLVDGLPFTSAATYITTGLATEVAVVGGFFGVYLASSSTSAVISTVAGGALTWTNGYVYHFTITYTV